MPLRPASVPAFGEPFAPSTLHRRWSAPVLTRKEDPRHTPHTCSANGSPEAGTMIHVLTTDGRGLTLLLETADDLGIVPGETLGARLTLLAETEDRQRRGLGFGLVKR